MKSKILSFLLIIGLSAPTHTTSSSAVSGYLNTALDTAKTVLYSQKTLAALHFLPSVMSLISILPLYSPNVRPVDLGDSVVPTNTESGQFIHRTVEELAKTMGIKKPCLVLCSQINLCATIQIPSYPEGMVLINRDILNSLTNLTEFTKDLKNVVIEELNERYARIKSDTTQMLITFNPIIARIVKKVGMESARKIFKGIMAHELAHIKNNDLLYMGPIELIAIPLLSWFVAKNGPMWLLGSQILGRLLVCSYQHYSEYRADFDGVCACNNPNGLISFLKLGTRLSHKSSYNASQMVLYLFLNWAPDFLTSLFTTLDVDVAEVDPTLKRIAHIFLSHPSNEDRINALQKLITPEHRASEIYNDTKVACIQQLKTMQSHRCDMQAATAAESSKSEVPHVMTAAVTTHESSINHDTKSKSTVAADASHGITTNDANPAAQPAKEPKSSGLAEPITPEEAIFAVGRDFGISYNP